MLKTAKDDLQCTTEYIPHENDDKINNEEDGDTIHVNDICDMFNQLDSLHVIIMSIVLSVSGFWYMWVYIVSYTLHTIDYINEYHGMCRYLVISVVLCDHLFYYNAPSLRTTMRRVSTMRGI